MNKIIEVYVKEINEFSRDFGELPEFPTPYGLPKITPKEAHPRVWINSKTVEASRKNMNHPENKYCLDMILEKANKEGDGKLPPRGEKSHNYTLDSISDIECIAYMYLMTKDKEYGYRAIRNALNWLDTIDFDKPKDSVEHYNMANVASYSILVMGELYDWCYELLTEKTKRQIAIGTANRLGPNLEVGYPPNGLGAITGHGTSAQILRDWHSFAIATYDEFPEFYNCVVGRILGEYREAPNFYYPSGANFQGSAYGINKTYLHMVSELIAKNMSGEKIYAPDVSFEATVATYLHYHRPDGDSLRIGDDYNQRGKTYGLYDFIRLAFFGSVYYNNPAFKAWARELTGDFKGIKWAGRCELNPMIFVLLNNPELPSDISYKYSLPLVNYCKSPMGMMIARSAWGDENAWMTYSKVGEIYGANHDHKDAGSFQIYYKGPLALTSSCYEFCGREPYGSLLDKGYNKQTISVNSLLIYNNEYPPAENVWEEKWLNSGGQRFRGEANNENGTLSGWLAKSTSHQAKILAHDYGYNGDGSIKYAYIAGDITNAYDEITVKNVVRHTISINTNNKAHPLMFVVYDVVESVKPTYKKKFILHTTDEPVIRGNSFSFTNREGKHIIKSTLERSYNGKLTNTTLFPKDVCFDVIGGDGKRFFVNGQNLADEYREGDPEGRQEVGWGRVEISATSENLEDKFLNVMYVGDADKDDPYIPAELIESQTHNGALSMNTAILFPKTKERISDDVRFEIKSESDITYYIAGLAAGEWCVRVDNKKLGKFAVTEASGLLNFTAKSGEIVLSTEKQV